MNVTWEGLSCSVSLFLLFSVRAQLFLVPFAERNRTVLTRKGQARGRKLL